MKSTVKLMSVSVLSFICGMQLDRGLTIQLNFLSHFPYEGGRVPAARVTSMNNDEMDIDANVEVVRNTAPVERIILLGERHSGTNWITDHLDKCFGGNVTVNDEYTRYKHWFQEDTVRPEKSVVVVAMFRDPLDWVEAMRWEPHHAHDHIHFHKEYAHSPRSKKNIYWRQIADTLPWKEFVTKPWVGRRGPNDARIGQTQAGIDSVICMDNYRYVDAAPCSIDDADIVKGLGEYKYEFQPDGSERGYSSIIDLRRDKIKNHLSVAEFNGTRDFLPYRYEDLKSNGTASLLKDVEEATGLKANCDAIYGKIKEANATEISKLSVRHRQLGRKRVTETRELSVEYIRYMNRNVDWAVERLVGYYPRQE